MRHVNFKYIAILAAGKRTLFCMLLMIGFHILLARPPVLSGKDMYRVPPKIIRKCCAFGADLTIARIPGYKKSDITSVQELGQHYYMGNDAEVNGIIYTRRGGFIDIGHLRDLADWTGYLFHLVRANAGENNQVVWDLGREGGDKQLVLEIPPDLDTQTMAEVAGMIAYDLSVWHEIATWFGVSYIPLLPEIYSSFSPEDLYSNLLGVQLGIEAINSDLPYDEAMTLLLANTMSNLEAVETAQETFKAMMKVEGIWWRNDRTLPSSRILLVRYMESGQTLYPWLLPDREEPASGLGLVKSDLVFSRYYLLTIKLSKLFILHTRKCMNWKREVASSDFPNIMQCIYENPKFWDRKSVHLRRKEKNEKAHR